MIKEEYAYCLCCEQAAMFSSNNEWYREFYICSNCNCVPRERHLMYIIEQVLPNWKELFIHESSPVARGVSEKLKKYNNNYLPSQFYHESSQEYINGFKNIDLHDQNFDDESFDLVVTQDVFEHLPKPEQAIKEVCRTLKKNGYFISTIPLVNKYNPTEKWAEIDKINAEITFLFEPEYHFNPISDQGSPVFWHFGYDIASKFIEWTGMETIILNNTIPKYAIEGQLLEVIVCKKI